MSFRKSQKNTISFGRSKANLAHRESSQLSMDTIFLECPICNARIKRSQIDRHVEQCLAASNQLHKAASNEDKKVSTTSLLAPNAETSPSASNPESLPSPIKAVASPSGTPLKVVPVKGTNLSTPPRQSRNERRPLAERMRPTTFKDIMGNVDILGQDAMIRRLMQRDPPPSMILFGPPGCGKTTIASVISHTTKCPFKTLSCCTSGMQDIRDIAEQAQKDQRTLHLPTVLFMDEIHRFNKKQQDVFLPFVEQGTLVLIGATTENPSFSINSALLSRCQVIPLKVLSVDDLLHILHHALDTDLYLKQSEAVFSEEVLRTIAIKSDGDARMALNMVDACAACVSSRSDKIITEELINSTFKQRFVRYDKRGEEHYNLASALQKSIRGSDVQAAIYWLGRMIEGGEDPLFVARRLLVIASEDVGLADPYALTLASACFQACKDIGVPECNLALTECASYLALTSKSNEIALAYNRARDLVHNDINPPVPLHIRNAPIESMEALGYGIGYQYGYNKNQTYLPRELLDKRFIDVSRAVTDVRSCSLEKYVDDSKRRKQDE